MFNQTSDHFERLISHNSTDTIDTKQGDRKTDLSTDHEVLASLQARNTSLQAHVNGGRSVEVSSDPWYKQGSVVLLAK
jgi:hypothetical protein